MKPLLYIVSIRALDKPALYDRAHAIASKERRRKADAFVHMDDRKRALAAELLLREALAEQNIGIENLEYWYGTYGKPFLVNIPLEFSISHSGDYVILAVSSEPVGCDIERIGTCNLRTARRCLTDHEYRILMDTGDEAERAQLFFRYWVLKESYVKRAGEGFHIPMKSLEINFMDDSVMMRKNSVEQDCRFSESDRIPGYRIAVCSGSSDIAVKELRLTDLKYTAL